jgi:hypothetical protein
MFLNNLIINMACVIRFLSDEDGSILLGLCVLADDASHGYSFPSYVLWQGIS